MPKVMIVDDDRTMVSLLRILLEMDGFDVVHVANHDEILERMDVEKPDLVLMDVFLANQDGMDLLAQIRQKQNLMDIRVVMTSGMDLADQAINAGADAFLLKPYTPEQLIETINQNLRNAGEE